MPNPLSSTQLAAYAALYDFPSQFNNAVKQVHQAYDLDDAADQVQTGQGVQELPRTATRWSFELGAATGATAPMALNFGAGAWRHPGYSEFDGTLTFEIVAPFEQEEAAAGPIYRVASAHVREMDRRAAQLYAIWQESLVPFKSSGDFLPKLDVITIRPIEPDERPEELREVNIRRVRFAIRFAIRQSAWPSA
jgi:hypothetical protein